MPPSGARRRAPFAALAASLALSGVPIAALAESLGGALPAAATVSGWNAATAPGPATVDAVACVPGSPGTCWTSGGTGGVGKVVASGNGGASWTPQALPGGVGAATSISCTVVGANDDCWAAAPAGGQNLVVATVGGAPWATQTVPPGIASLTSVACVPATTDCYATGVTPGVTPVIVDTTDGSTWSIVAGAIPPTVQSLGTVTCPSASTCLAVGVANTGGNPPIVIATTNSGATWTIQQLPAVLPAGVVLSGISCPSTMRCVAAGYDGGRHSVVLATGNGGTTWYQQSVPDVSVIGNAACPAVGTCIGSVTCPAVGSCYAVGAGSGAADAILATADGTNWYAQTVTGGAYQGLASVACTSSSTCLAVGTTGGAGDAVATVDQGGAAPGPATTGTPVAYGGNATATVGWTPPATGGPVTSYTIVPNPTCTVCSGLSVPGTQDFGVVTGLTNGTAYTFTVKAATGGGTSAASAPSAAVTPNPPALTQAPSWTTQLHDESLNATTCVSATQCWAVGSTDPSPTGSAGLILTSSNGGATWTAQTVPGGVGVLDGIGCASATSCFATGYTIDSATHQSSGVLLSTANGGATWTADPVPAGVKELDSVVCPSATQCVAVGGRLSGASAVLFSFDGGATWSPPALPSTATTLRSAACPSVNECIAIGDAVGAGLNATVLDSADGGAVWSVAATPPAGLSAPAGLTSIACTTASSCIAVGPAFSQAAPATTEEAVTVDGGVHWSTQAVSASLDDSLTSVTCAPATSHCWASGGAGPPGAGGTSGPPAAVFASVDSGSTWSPQVAPVAVADVVSVSCAAPSACAAVGSTRTAGPVAVTTTDGGATWPLATSGVVPTVSAVSCADAGDCVAVGSPWGTESTSNGGGTWTSHSLPVGITALDGVSCATASFCLAGGTAQGTGGNQGGNGALVVTTNAGATWSTQQVPSTVTAVDGVACASTTQCFAVGASVNQNTGVSTGVLLATVDGGASWVSEMPAGSSITVLSSIACPSPSVCVAVGTTGAAAGYVFTTDGGTAWSKSTTAIASSFVSVSCSSVTACAAAGVAAGPAPVVAFSLNGGSSWTASTLPPAVRTPPPNVTASVDAVSCLSDGACVVGGSVGGQAFAISTSNQGAGWNVATVSPAAANTAGVSCPVPNSCFAIYGGIAFSALSGIAAPSAPTALTATAAGTSANLSWTAPTGNGGSTITGYTIVPTPACACGGLTVAGSATTATVTGLTSGTSYTFTVAATNSAGTGPPSGASNAVTASAVTVTTTTVSNGTVGLAYSQALAATGGTTPYTWKVTLGALPAGLTLSTAGTISGTPTSAGAQTFTVQVTDSASPANAATGVLTLTVGATALAITSTSPLPVATVATSYSTTLTESGGTGPFTWSVLSGGLPAGLSLSKTSGVISGTATTANLGPTSIIVEVVDSSVPPQSATATFVINVVSKALIPTTSQLPNAQAGVPYAQSLGAQGGVAPYFWSLVWGALPSGLTLSSTGVISGTPSVPVTSLFEVQVADSESPTPSALIVPYGLVVQPAPSTQAYWFFAADGGPFSFGAAKFFGSMGGQHLAAPVVGAAASPDGQGYWEVASDGGVFAFGDAGFFGSMGGQSLNAPIVAMAATSDGQGYWLAAADGGIFAFGDASFFGSLGIYPSVHPLVALAATPDSRGYWLVASNGAVFAFGDARYLGSMGGQVLAAPVVALSPTPDGLGYWLASTDGGIFAFGDARYFGSIGGAPLASPVVAVVGSLDGQGYWEMTADGRVFNFGDAAFEGSMAGVPLAAPIVAAVAP